MFTYHLCQFVFILELGLFLILFDIFRPNRAIIKPAPPTITSSLY